MTPLEGKVALITGAGQNIGRAIALQLAAMGAAVAVNGRSDRALVDAVVGEIASAGGRAAGVMGDVSKPAEVEALTAQCVEELGGIDIVVSNAGLRRQTPLIEALGLDLNETGYVKVNDMLETSIPGIYAAGDVLTSRQQVHHAIHTGAVAGGNVASDLITGSFCI